MIRYRDCGLSSTRLRTEIFRLANHDAISQQPDSEKLILTTAYSAIVQHWVHAEETRWTLLYNYFMGSSILLLAWAAVFTSASPGRRFLLVVLAASGLVISVLWICLLDRASGFIRMYSDLGRSVEESLKARERDGNDFALPFTCADKHRDAITGIRRFGASWVAAIVVPAVFLGVYLVLLIFALCPKIS